MKSDFESQAQNHSEIGFFRELLGFMINNKKWWLLPILVTLGLVGVLILLSTTAAAPFIYTLF